MGKKQTTWRTRATTAATMAADSANGRRADSHAEWEVG